MPMEDRWRPINEGRIVAGEGSNRREIDSEDRSMVIDNRIDAEGLKEGIGLVPIKDG